MRDQDSIKVNEVAIVKGPTPQDSVTKGIKLLGGITKFIEEGDQIFIKFNLNLPFGYPTNTNFELLKSLIESCNMAGASKVYLGSFPAEGTSIKAISDLLNLKGFFENFGAELAFLDKSDFFYGRKFKEDEAERIKSEFFLSVKVNGKEFLIPKIIIHSDKFISVNQVNVNPLFKLNLSLFNSYSIIPPKYQRIKAKDSNDDIYLQTDQYKKDLISNILQVFSLKEPDLVINDMFYLLDNAGPNIYKDSELKKIGIVILGNNAVSVDAITLKLVNLDILSYDLVVEAQKKKLGNYDLQKINLYGENPEDLVINVEFCKSKLEDINLKNFNIRCGQYCSGCYAQAYDLLNFMKSHMTKDLKYNPCNTFLIGKNPLEPSLFKNIIIFGDCAIESTKDGNFRKISKQSDKIIIGDIINPKNKKKKTRKEPKIKFKTNKNILELPGCPPEINNSLNLIFKYYGRNNTPNLTIYRSILESWRNPKIKEKLKILEII